MWVLLDMSTKRRGLYITYTPTRAADGSDGERTPWDAMHRIRKGVNGFSSYAPYTYSLSVH